MSTVSVVTLAKGRPAHLRNVLLGLARQTRPPAELIVAVMQDAPYDLPEVPFPVRQILVPGRELPLAAARNRGVAAACGDDVVFLDVDCIPAPSLVADYARGLAALDGLLMGEVLHLPERATAGDWRYADLDAVAERHSDRRGPPASGIEICNDYRCFWSLNYAIRRATFLATGGFDERYTGYGGEDTDFGKLLATRGIPIAWMKGARAYHQYHPHHMPPVHHLDSVVRNAELFASKWGYRTMGHWLYAFRVMGLIDDTPDRPIRILRRPDAGDLALTGQQSHQPYTNSASVIRTLEARQVEGAAMASGVPAPATA
ncbi:galactosyltransferase-related protein [Methylobacterium sp. J-026]|uniref:glycosyltransferase family 2 protein n=1 Tax=Methylobacterium sp. J-026 TaxID=2836624 RepID=UPI001FBB808D|nr:galactosyltransferase-related protein [Methylobacterium sp. J-026]MCJ2133027.1 galactosyltransferase-related protein [Methylobacterium sp. J-026]